MDATAIDLQRYPFYGAAVNVDVWPFTRLRDPGVEVSSTIFNWAANVLGEITRQHWTHVRCPCPPGMLVKYYDGTDLFGSGPHEI